MKVRAVLLFFCFSISCDTVIRNCLRIKYYFSGFCTNEIHITFKQLSEKANGTL